MGELRFFIDQETDILIGVICKALRKPKKDVLPELVRWAVKSMLERLEQEGWKIEIRRTE